MSDERRRQQRRERQRRRTSSRPQQPQQAAPVGAMPLPGVFGWVQRNGRLFALMGMVVLVLSLGGGFLLNQTANSSSTIDPTPAPTMAATTEPTATPTFGPVGTPSADGVFRTFNGPPPMEIDEHGQYQALIRTERGDIRIQLLPEASPEHVNNFVFLARNRFFDGLTFHRVIPGFVAQAGDPLGTSQGGPGYTLPRELNSLPMDAGMISMAAGQQGVSGSQFFITMEPQPDLKTNGFNAFGRVTDGLEVVRALTTRDPQQPAQPPGDRILSVEIIEGGN